MLETIASTAKEGPGVVRQKTTKKKRSGGFGDIFKQYHTRDFTKRPSTRPPPPPQREREREKYYSHSEKKKKKKEDARLPALTLLQHPATKSGVVVSLFFLQLKQHRPFSFFFGQRERGNVSKKSSQVLVRV